MPSVDRTHPQIVLDFMRENADRAFTGRELSEATGLSCSQVSNVLVSRFRAGVVLKARRPGPGKVMQFWLPDSAFDRVYQADVQAQRSEFMQDLIYLYTRVFIRASF